MNDFATRIDFQPDAFACVTDPSISNWDRRHFLRRAFVFAESPQGHGFWADYAYDRRPFDAAFWTAIAELEAALAEQED